MNYREMAEAFFDEMCHMTRGPVNRKANDISHGEMGVLVYLVEVKDYAAPGEISSHRRISTARIANTLASLERKKLIERLQDQQDRRKVIVRVTGEGRRLVEDKREEAISGYERLLCDMGEKDAREYLRLTRKVNQLIREAEARGDTR